MSYSIDLRNRVVAFVRNGGSKAEASRRYEVSIWCISDWMKREDLMPIKVIRRKGKLDWEAVKKHVETHPDALLRERAEHFKVHINAIWNALEKMNLTHKKKPKIPGA